MKISSEKLASKILIAVLLISILAVYCQIKNFESVYYDEPKYVRNNPMLKLGITLDGIRWAFSSIGYAANWHPVTWISHMLYVEFYGLNPEMYHFTKVIA
jgi:protein O-mannosyl-transferase